MATTKKKTEKETTETTEQSTGEVDKPEERIAPGKTPTTGTEKHEIETSRGNVLGFHQTPQLPVE